MAEFLVAIEIVLKHEGGDSNDVADRGGRTRYGISAKAHPNVDIEHLTLDGAKRIYLEKYWIPGKYGQIHDQAVATKIFDMAVNMGPKRAHTLTQRALQALGIATAIDGLMGSATIVAINVADAGKLLDAIKAEAAKFYQEIASKDPSQNKFLKGWLTRAYA